MGISRVLVVLGLLVAVASATTAHRGRHRHHHHSFPAPPAGMPPVPPFFGPGPPGMFPQPGVPGLAGMAAPPMAPGAGLPGPGAPTSPMPFPRMMQVGLNAKAKSTQQADKDIVRAVYNLLSKSRDMNVEDTAKLNKERKKNQMQEQKLLTKQKMLKQRMSMLTRLEYCLEVDNTKKANITTASNATAVSAANSAALAALAAKDAALNKRKAAMDEREKQLKERESKLKFRLIDLRKREAALQTKLHNANLAAANAAASHAHHGNHTGAKEKVQIKYVKVPQTIYKVAPTGCVALTDCATCTASPTCGWCEATKKCLSSVNGTTGQCDADSWSFNFCKFHKCVQHTACRSCMADPRCGRCADSGTCMFGSLTGPTKGTCTQWNYATDMRFLSYNVYGRDMRNISGRASWLFKMIRQADPDFIALQEVEDWFLAALSKQRWALNYHTSDFGSGHAPGGLLIMSKVPLESVSYYEKTDPGQVEVDQRGRMLVVRPKMGSRNLVLATTTLDWRSSTSRVASLDYVTSVLNSTADVLLMGDFNFDAQAQPETAHIPRGYIDLWPRVHPSLKGYTWDPVENSYAKESDPTSRPSRIDRMFVKSGFWQPSKIDKIGCPEASPHYGLLAELSVFGAYC